MENKCENCIEFIQHYRLFADSAYKINFAHCCKTGKFLDLKKNKECPNFQPKKVISEEERYIIKQSLNKIEESLAKIKTYIETKKD